MSHDGNSWSRHCRGLVNSGRASKTPGPELKTFPRRIDSDRWYKTMARIGLNYGPRFTGLREVTASVTDEAASARVTDRQESSESSYALHPTTLDRIFQSWILAQKKGVYRELKTLLLPTYIEELYVGCATSATIDFNTSVDDGHVSSYGVLVFASHSECLNSFKNVYLVIGRSPAPGLAHIEAYRGVCSHLSAEELSYF